MLRSTLIASGFALGLFACAPAEDAATQPSAEQDERSSLSEIRERFPDYEPKTSPDTVLDYDPMAAALFAGLPTADADNLDALTEAFAAHRQKALTQPGVWEDGNIALGADPEEYAPSEAEIVASELGDRLRQALRGASPDQRSQTLETLGEANTYPVITYRHVDVIGSGRFTYASEPEWRPVWDAE